MKKTVFFLTVLLFPCFSFAQTTVKETLVAPVLSAFPVGFSLLTHGQMQFVAFYDPDHRMTVGSRRLDDSVWTFRILPSRIGWDSHNSIVMQVDSDDQLHLSGNMHAVPLVYFRTSVPLDIASFEKIDYMTGENESRVTYPTFMKGPEGSLIFHYRDGSSGNGNEIYNLYDPRSKSWKRLMDKPLMDGEGQMNAYMNGPTLGPDGFYHLVWVWRDTYHCETNHHLSYARSRNLTQWESVDGKPVPLPITIAREELWVDPVPPQGGIINGAARIGFDPENRLLITYHKFDPEGNTQAYIARFTEGRWETRQLSHWDYRWYFSGGGSIVFEVTVNGARPTGEHTLRIGYNHIKYGEGYWLVDAKTLEVIEEVAVKSPEDVRPSTEITLSKRTARDSGQAPAGKHYELEWESLPQNRDTLRSGIEAPPSLLKVIERTGRE